MEPNIKPWDEAEFKNERTAEHERSRQMAKAHGKASGILRKTHKKEWLELLNAEYDMAGIVVHRRRSGIEFREAKIIELQKELEALKEQ